jgi:serine/threonine protein kinase
MDDAEPVLVPGYRLDRYELLTPIASGGMASVWLARLRGKRGFEKLFAIKTIKTELTGDARFQEMFLDEARIASGIQHPNVSQILDLGEQGDILYIVMEWVDGESLAKIRRLVAGDGKRVPLGLALRIIGDACAGLHAAHELTDRQNESLEVVHRDVSPHNLLVTSAGSVKVIDFGVAKARDRLAGDTASGVVKGKIRYMAPEQAQGGSVDRRADVWAMGACLYELVTGEPPFDGESEVAIIRRLLGDEPLPRVGGPVPEAVDAILAHSLARDPAERFATAAAMQRAIEVAIDELGLSSTSEDVAQFLRESLPELEAKRRQAVEKALAAAQARDGETGSPRLPAVTDDAADAPTVVSERRPGTRSEAVEAKTVSLPKKKADAGAKAEAGAKKKKRPRAQASAPDESKATLAAAALAKTEDPPRRELGGWWSVILVAAVGAGAWFVWPGGEQLRRMIGSGAPPEPTSAAIHAAPPAVTAGPPPAVPVSAASIERVTATVTAIVSASASAAPPPSAPVDAGAPPAAASQASASASADAAPAEKPIRKPRVRAPAGEEPGDDPAENRGPYD